MSMSRLQEAEMSQEFHPNDSSTLFMRHPERLLRRPEQGHRGKVLTFGALGKGIDESLTVLVDTGANVRFCITKTGLDKVEHMTDKWSLPEGRVLMEFSCCTYTLLLQK
ncbi:hypothetical protein E2C01_024814 [Portunus trituberculatus]|uniref:Uncharacterized protein n=1 Tax=Portunus trituberculatus TaxID=210409 RepID=A0A5B7EBR0_PORTR|nr:hypothetical protein [Portunus trituberculatus]